VALESHTIRQSLADFVVAKEELERQTEHLIKKVVAAASPNESISLGHVSLEQSMIKRSLAKSNSTGAPTSTVIKQGLIDMREMGEVVKELTQLVGNMLAEKAALAQALA
jgi:hypothetical protein